MEAIVSEVLAGKRGATTKFYRSYARKVRAYLLGRLSDDQDVEDVLQETF